MADKATEFWRTLDLVGLQRDLDRDAEEISKRREESDQSRRELVEASQTFRASAPEVPRPIAYTNTCYIGCSQESCHNNQKVPTRGDLASNKGH